MYTNVSKPIGANYTDTNPQGKEQYDQLSLTYDDSNTFYDGVWAAAYTDVAKPVLNPHYTWAMAAFSWASATFAWNSGGLIGGYTNVSKPV